MSNTFSLICPETKQKIWIGQGRGLTEMATFYSGEQTTMARLHRFLNATFGKNLMVVCNDTSDFIHEDEWQEFEEPEDEKRG